MSKAILVLGATGKQGGAVVRCLLSHSEFSPEKYTIYAATRDPTSASAQRLAGLSPSIIPVAGDLRDSATTFSKLPTNPWAVFAMTYPGKTELVDGIGTIDAAVASGVSHIVFSSVDRGQDSPSTDVPHFITKHNIEAHLKSVSAESKGALSYTIIRPPFFLDNLEPGFLGKVMATLWRNRVARPLAMVDTSDIGSFAAAALLEPTSSTYHNAGLDIAGDNLTFEKANEIFKQKTGKNIPTTFSFIANLLPWMMSDIRKMFEFFDNQGFVGTPEESNKLHRMTNFEEWLEKSKHPKLQNSV